MLKRHMKYGHILKSICFLSQLIKKKNQKNMLMTLKKGSWSLEEYLRNLKNVGNNLVAIKNPNSGQDKVF